MKCDHCNGSGNLACVDCKTELTEQNAEECQACHRPLCFRCWVRSLVCTDCREKYFQKLRQNITKVDFNHE